MTHGFSEVLSIIIISREVRWVWQEARPGQLLGHCIGVTCSHRCFWADIKVAVDTSKLNHLGGLEMPLTKPFSTYRGYLRPAGASKNQTI